MEAIQMIPYVALALIVAGIVLGAGTITVAEFGDTIEPCYNSSYSLLSATPGNAGLDNACNESVAGDMGSAGKEGLNLSDGYYAVVKSQAGMQTVGEQQATVAIIAVMVIIISVLAGLFAYFKYFG